MANLIEGLQEQMNRVRELLKEYEEIGPAGVFGTIMLKAEIKNAEASIASGDTIRMLQCYESLKMCN